MVEKLVRDKIPDIIRARNEEPEVRVASKKEHDKLLKEKLLEEVWEFLGAKGDKEAKEELADVLEVVDGIIKERGYERSDIEKIKQNKKKERGGFEKRLVLNMEKVKNR